MNWTSSSWILIALISFVVLTLMVFKILCRRQKRSAPGRREEWFAAAATSAAMLVFIAVKVIDLIPNTTAVNVGALSITGLFLGLGLVSAHTNAAGGS